MNIVVCDDESIYRGSISDKIEMWARQQKKGNAVAIRAFSSSEELLEAWERGLRIDLLFLDVQIPNELSGIEIAKQIHSVDEYIPIVFITNYIEYACEGYLVNALRYIVKPIDQASINECMEIAWKRWSLAQQESLRVEYGKQLMMVPIRSIIMLESLGHMLKIHIAGVNDGIELRARLKDYYMKLPAGLFSQCHKSYIVNVMYVRKIQPNEIVLANGTQVSLGRKYATDFLKLFNEYYQGGS